MGNPVLQLILQKNKFFRDSNLGLTEMWPEVITTTPTGLWMCKKIIFLQIVKRFCFSKAEMQGKRIYFKRKEFISKEKDLFQKKRIYFKRKVFLHQKKRISTFKRKGFIWKEKWSKEKKRKFFLPTLCISPLVGNFKPSNFSIQMILFL